MKIKKLGHCCLVIEIDGKRVMTDPGSFTVENQEQELNIDLIVITHEHADHLHTGSLKNILTKNPTAAIVTNTAVGKILAEAQIQYQKLEEGQSGEFAGVYLEAHGQKHAFIRSGVEPVENTGYFIGKDLFYPGDAFTNPNTPVRILALPVAAPWLTIEHVFQYAKEVHPQIAFPVHDGMLNELGLGFTKNVLSEILTPLGINFKSLEIGKEEEL